MDKIKSLKMKHCSNAFKSPNESSGEVDYYSDIAKCEGIDLGWNACHEFMIGQAQSEFDKNLESTKVISGTYAWGLDMVKDSKLDYAHEGFLAGARNQQDRPRGQYSCPRPDLSSPQRATSPAACQRG